MDITNSSHKSATAHVSVQSDVPNGLNADLQVTTGNHKNEDIGQSNAYVEEGAPAATNAAAAERYSRLSLTRTLMDRVNKTERESQLVSILDSLEDPLSRFSPVTRKRSSTGVDAFAGEVISNTLRDGRKRTASATGQTCAEQTRRKAMRLDLIPPKRKS
jgi:hypothetical protein